MTAPPPEAWLLTALKVTGHFEDAASPLAAVTGDFDGMGISLGVLQWNIGSGSLQPMVASLGREAVVAALPTCGEDLWRACTSDVREGLALCRSWQTGAVLKPRIKAELAAFTGGERFVSCQLRRAAEVGARAYEAARAYAAQAQPGAEPGKDVFCWFFDVYTQNGGLKGLTYADAADFIAASGTGKADDVICDWLAARTSAFAGFRDSLRNAALWRDNVPPAKLHLFVLSYLRAQKSRLEYRADVLNRKATIALGQGWVHGEKHDLAALFA